ncbi:hypothetical protein J19TS2_16450 [Cohnella xylanilytica]|nr:hypothetical protein J19TS2_16450 [Cohnella xylanilytica]
MAQALGIVEVAPTDANSAFPKLMGLIRIADADADSFGRQTFKQPFYYGAP